MSSFVRKQYYTLVASLPALPHFRAAEHLPISRERLLRRIRMLTPADLATVNHVREFIAWQAQPPDRTDEQVAHRYNALLEKNPHPVAKGAIVFRMDIRTIMAGLRRRHLGEEAAPDDPHWGVGHWKSHIEKNWSHPDFRLAHVFNWIPLAREHLESGDSLALEDLLMNEVWTAIDKITFGSYFQLENVIAYLFKWDILNRWLSNIEVAALEQFEELAAAMRPLTDEIADAA